MSTANLPNQRRFSMKNLNPFAQPAPGETIEPTAGLDTTTDPTPSTPAPPDLITLAQLAPRPIDWLWPRSLAAETLALLCGPPGAGKTWLALAFAASLSRGRAPYTGDELSPCSTLYVSSEHDAAQIIQPRFAAQDGDPDRLTILRLAPPAKNPAQPDHALLLQQLKDALNHMQTTSPVRLVILDSLDVLFGPNVTPGALDQLRRLAEHHHCCILLLRHLHPPGPGRPAFRHSCDFTHAVRTEFLAGASPDAPTQPVLLHTRSNLAPLTPALAYSITDDGLRFTGLSQLTPLEIFAGRPTGAGLPLRKFAANWLRQQLAGGSKKQYLLESDAIRDGVSIATLKRARFDLGVISTKDGTSGSWFWTLPYNPEEHQNN